MPWAVRLAAASHSRPGRRPGLRQVPAARQARPWAWRPLRGRAGWSSPCGPAGASRRSRGRRGHISAGAADEPRPSWWLADRAGHHPGHDRRPAGPACCSADFDAAAFRVAGAIPPYADRPYRVGLALTMPGVRVAPIEPSVCVLL